MDAKLRGGLAEMRRVATTHLDAGAPNFGRVPDESVRLSGRLYLLGGQLGWQRQCNLVLHKYGKRSERASG